MAYKDKERKREYQRQYRETNKEKIKEQKRKRKEANREYYKEYYQKNREKINKRNSEWIKNYRQNHPEEVRQKDRDYYRQNIEREKERARRWRKKNPERVREILRKSRKKQRKTNLKYLLKDKITTAMYKAIKENKAGRRWEDLVGYSVDDLIKHLKKTMPEEYAWSDYFKGKLHIDHIIPMSVFNFTKAEHTDFKRCWALKNLRLLSAEENMLKRDKLYKPFQPTLKI